VPLDGGDARSLDVEHGAVVVAAVQGANAAIEVFDAASGARRSLTYVADGREVFASLSDDGRVVVGLVAGEQGAPQVMAMNEAGDLLWSGGVDAMDMEGTAALVREDDSVALIDVATGDERWSAAAPPDAVVALVGGRAFVASRSEVVAYDAQGTEMWRQGVPADEPDSMLGQGEDLLVLLRTNGVLAMSAEDGMTRWEAPAGGVVGDTAPTALVLRLTEDDVTFRVLDGDDGSTRATRLLEPTAGVSFAADVIYVGDGVGVTAYDRESLQRLWSTVVADSGDSVVLEAVEGGVLVSDGEGGLIVLR
jgi:outer membrane protein assembly factor BamB